MLISIATHTNKPVYGLNMDARGIPKEGWTNAVLTISAFTPRGSMRKLTFMVSVHLKTV